MKQIPCNKYFPIYSRPGTVAAKWKKVDSKEEKRSSTKTAKLFKSYPKYNHLKNTIQKVCIHDTKDEGRNPDENFIVGHRNCFKNHSSC